MVRRFRSHHPPLQAKGMQGLGKPASTNVVGVTDAARVTLTADMLVEGMHPSRAPALAALVFTGPGGKEMEGPNPRLHQSDRYGSFVYLGESAREGNVPARVTFPIPPGAIKMSVRIFPWGAKSLSLMEEPSFVLNFDGAGTAEGSLIATIDAPVRAGETYEIGYRQSTAIETFNKFALLRPHFSDRVRQADECDHRRGPLRSVDRAGSAPWLGGKPAGAPSDEKHPRP